MLKISDSMNQNSLEFNPINKNEVKMYVCGPTVYDNPHLGHARCYITWDVVYRYLKFLGYNVKYCRNVTDIDDKILNKADQNKCKPNEITTKYYNIFKESMNNLNVLSPTYEPKATECINEMIELIQKLINNGYAYEVQGDVYFRVKKFKDYGKLSKQPLNDIKSGARVQLGDKKEDDLDFALWKKDEKHGFKSPWGLGRPGWHIECSAMAKKYLGDTIDIHAGGADLIFPHHENEIAQSEAANGVKFVNYWLHNGFVTINKEKMSKSLNNFISINDLLQKYDKNTIRLFILTNHYRTGVEFNDEALYSAKNGTKRLHNAVNEGLNQLNTDISGIFNEFDIDINNINNLKYNDIKEKFNLSQLESFIIAMDNDFNTSKALAILFDLAYQINKFIEVEDNESIKKYLALLIILSNILGLSYINPSCDSSEKCNNALSQILDKIDFLSEEEKQLPINEIMNCIISKRTYARENKNWNLADKIRNTLKQVNIIIKDTKNGVKVEFDPS